MEPNPIVAMKKKRITRRRNGNRARKQTKREKQRILDQMIQEYQGSIALQKKMNRGGGEGDGDASSTTAESEATPAQATNYFYKTKNISTQPNIDPNFEEIGIVHVTSTTGVNIVREAATGIANIFGRSGFDNSRYDEARNDALKALAKEMEDQRIDRVCNVRMDTSVGSETSSMVIVNIYGTALRRKGGSLDDDSDGNNGNNSLDESTQSSFVEEKDKEEKTDISKEKDLLEEDKEKEDESAIKDEEDERERKKNADKKLLPSPDN